MSYAQDQGSETPDSSINVNGKDNVTDIDINTQIVNGNGYAYLSPEIVLKNETKNDQYLYLGKEAITITRVVAKNDKIIPLNKYHPKLYSEVSSTGNVPIENVFVPAYSTRKLNYLTMVDHAGMYYITFQADILDSNGKKVLKILNGLPMKLFESKYVYVK